MDYMADPIWVSHSDKNAPCSNVDMGLFSFPLALKHLLYCYQQAWETAHSSEFIPLENLSDECEANPEMSNAIDASIDALGSACEDMLEAWLKENDWDTKLYREPSFT